MSRLCTLPLNGDTDLVQEHVQSLTPSIPRPACDCHEGYAELDEAGDQRSVDNSCVSWWWLQLWSNDSLCMPGAERARGKRCPPSDLLSSIVAVDIKQLIKELKWLLLDWSILLQFPLLCEITVSSAILSWVWLKFWIVEKSSPKLQNSCVPDDKVEAKKRKRTSQSIRGDRITDMTLWMKSLSLLIQDHASLSAVPSVRRVTFGSDSEDWNRVLSSITISRTSSRFSTSS